MKQSARDFWSRALDEPGWELSECGLWNKRLDLRLWMQGGASFLDVGSGHRLEIPLWGRWALWRKARKVRLSLYYKRLEGKAGA